MLRGQTITVIPSPFITFEKVDWKELADQKKALVLAIDARRDQYPEDGTDPLQGILHLLDYIQDSAAQQLGDEFIYGN